MEKLESEILGLLESIEFDVELVEQDIIVEFNDSSMYICYQYTDMNGDNRLGANYDNPGANSGLTGLCDYIISHIDMPESSSAYVDKRLFVYDVIANFCEDLFRKHDLANIFRESLSD